MIQTNRKSKFPPWKGGGQRKIAKDKGILPHMDNYKALTGVSVAGLQEKPGEDEQLAKLGVMYQLLNHQSLPERGSNM